MFLSFVHPSPPWCVEQAIQVSTPPDHRIADLQNKCPLVNPQISGTKNPPPLLIAFGAAMLRAVLPYLSMHMARHPCSLESSRSPLVFAHLLKHWSVIWVMSSCIAFACISSCICRQWQPFMSDDNNDDDDDHDKRGGKQQAARVVTARPT